MQISFNPDEWRLIRDALLEESSRLKELHIPPKDRRIPSPGRAERIRKMDAIRADIVLHIGNR